AVLVSELLEQREACLTQLLGTGGITADVGRACARAECMRVRVGSHRRGVRALEEGPEPPYALGGVVHHPELLQGDGNLQPELHPATGECPRQRGPGIVL